jgi:PAS domain S-box-containing protein
MVWASIQRVWHRITPSPQGQEASPRSRRLQRTLTGYGLPTGAVLLFLLLWARSQAINLTQHNQYVDALRQLQELDARINQNLLQLRLGLLTYYDPIVQEMTEIQQLQTVLQDPPDFVHAPQRRQLQQQVQDNVELWQNKDELIQQFKSKHAILRNSLAYFPIAISDLTDQTTLNPGLTADLRTLLQDVLLFNLSTDKELTPRLEDDIERLRRQVGTTPVDLSNPIAHAEIILENRPETDRLIEAILTLPTRQQGEVLAETYDLAYQRAIRSANLYRLGLYVLSTVLVMAIAASIITKLRAYARALQQSETRLRNIFDNTQVGIFRTRMEDSLIMAANQYFVEMLGYEDVDEVVGVQRSADFYADVKDRQKVLDMALSTGEVRNFETQFRKRDGSLCWVLFSCRVNPAENCLDKVIADITNRKLAEAALRRSEATKQALFQAIPDFMLRMYRGSSTFEVISTGKNSDRILKRQGAHQSIQDDIRDILPPEIVQQRLTSVQQALDTRKVQIYEQTLTIQGEQVWEEVRVVPCGTDDVLVMIRDICDRKQTEASLHRAMEEAQVANRAKSQFLSNMSHELRTPLNVILGYTQIMTSAGTLNAQQQGYLSSINQSGEHLLSLINDVLEMSKIEAGKITLNPSDFDLPGLLEGIYAMFQFKTSSKGIELQLERSELLPRYIHADEGKLRQVLVNLIGNAVKFTTSGYICLRASVLSEAPAPAVENGDQESGSLPLILQFDVEDTGSGIAPEHLDSLFEPFVQARSTQSIQEGTGLGLPISRRFVELMGGEISVSSRLGRGSQFRFTLPTQAMTLSQATLAEPERPVVGLAPGQPAYRILIAEDMPENRRILIDLLKPIGFEVREAKNGLEAVLIWQRWLPHLIWMDLRMPVMDGYEATKQLKAFGETAPVIIAITGSAFEEDRAVALAAGCDDFVRKPFRTTLIFEKMARFLGVRYLYGEPVPQDHQTGPSPGTSTTATVPITPADLQVMEAQWIEQLRQAATKVNGQQIAQLIQDIPPEYARLSDQLTHLVDNFCFEEIVALTTADS